MFSDKRNAIFSFAPFVRQLRTELSLMKKRSFIGLLLILMLFMTACSSGKVTTSSESSPSSSEEEPAKTDTTVDPTIAATAFIDVMLLGKENSNFEQSLTIDKDTAAATIQEQMNDEFPLNDLIEAHQEAFLEKFIAAQSKQSSVSVELVSNKGGKAQVSVTPTVITLSALNQNIKTLKMESSGNTKMYNFEAIGDYLLTNFDRVIGDAVPVTGEAIPLVLTSDNGKWAVDLAVAENADFVDKFYGVYGEQIP